MKIKNHIEISKKLWKLKKLIIELPNVGENGMTRFKILKEFEILKSRLDDFYHAGINEEEFKKFGHVYYGPKNERQYKNRLRMVKHK